VGVTFPFAGVMDVRPYPPTGLTTARWAAEVEPQTVEFAGLWLTQPSVNILALFGHSDRASDGFPHVVAWQGIHLLEDGHHRVVRAALCHGLTELPMRVFRSPN
jgi:hypothetical protein